MKNVTSLFIFLSIDEANNNDNDDFVFCPIQCSLCYSVSRRYILLYLLAVCIVVASFNEMLWSSNYRNRCFWLLDCQCMCCNPFNRAISSSVHLSHLHWPRIILYYMNLLPLMDVTPLLRTYRITANLCMVGFECLWISTLLPHCFSLTRFDTNTSQLYLLRYELILCSTHCRI